MLLHSRQKRKVICSWALVGCWAVAAASTERAEGAGDAMVLGSLLVGGCVLVVVEIRGGEVFVGDARV